MANSIVEATALAYVRDGSVVTVYPAYEPWMAQYDIRDASDVVGIAAGWVAPDDGTFAAPTAPTMDAAALQAYAAAARSARETGGLTINGALFATSLDSQNRIANAYAYVQASGAASVQFKATSGWITLTADQVKALALRIGAHVQACFATEEQADAGITASPPTITTPAQIDALFAALG